MNRWVDDPFDHAQADEVSLSPIAQASKPRATPTPAPRATPAPPSRTLAQSGSGVLAAPAARPVEGVELAPVAVGTVVTKSITYTYDAPYRLTAADYNDGTYFHYTYDATGNRLTEDTQGGLSIAYTYDNANRLKSVLQGATTYTFTYRCNGLSGSQWSAIGYESDQASHTVHGVMTQYVLDQAAEVTQVVAVGLPSQCG